VILSGIIEVEAEVEAEAEVEVEVEVEAEVKIKVKAEERKERSEGRRERRQFSNLILTLGFDKLSLHGQDSSLRSEQFNNETI